MGFHTNQKQETEKKTNIRKGYRLQRKNVTVLNDNNNYYGMCEALLSQNFLNLKATLWFLTHMNGNQFPSLSWENKLYQSHNNFVETNLCDYVLINDQWLDKVELYKFSFVLFFQLACRPLPMRSYLVPEDTLQVTTILKVRR